MEISADVFKCLIIDRARKRMGFMPQGGKVVWAPFEPSGESNVAQLIFDFDEWRAYATTTRGHAIISEVYSTAMADQTYGRLSAYLDQMHWRTVSDVLQGDVSRVRRASEIQAAQRLIRLVREAEVLIPLSRANVNEMTAMRGDLRYAAGVAATSLSAGWQMRDPMTVRTDEIRHALAAQQGIELPPPRPVITLEPFAVMGQSTGGDAASDSDTFRDCVTSAATILDMMVDLEAIEVADISFWVERQQAFTDKMAVDTESSKKQKRILPTLRA